MILKIQRYQDNQTWWILDDIRKVSISERNFHSGVPVVDDGMDAYIFDVRPRCKCVEEVCGDCVGYRTLICRLDSGEEYSIAFDTVAYLLNDNGNTIEKIVGNIR